jgi:protoporphyrin/coproporphyrin ferrochelatase
MKAVWLLQLGTPDEPSVSAVRRYLGEFLMDRRMIDLPFWLRLILVRGIIVPFRSGKSAKAYQNVWTAQGSPLMAHSRELQMKLQSEFPKIPILLSMRYGSPSIEEGMAELKKLGVDEVFLMPMFPQYSSATNGSILEKIFLLLSKEENIPAVKVWAPCYDRPEFIESMAQLAPKDLSSYDRILFSFHGYPEKYLKKSSAACLTPKCCDVVSSKNSFCYRAQSVATAKVLAQRLGLSQDRWAIGFQSRLGGSKWTDPYTDVLLVDWAKSGVKNVLVLCPSFVADCLETVEEIGIRERENFLMAGGQRLDLVPCVNASPTWIQYMSQEIKSFLT